jgi:hypothetical protein
MYEEGPGCLSMATNKDNIQHAHNMVLLDRRMTTDEVANQSLLWLQNHIQQTVQDGSQNKSQYCINKHVWTSGSLQ